MKHVFPGEMKLYHIFHDVHVDNTILESNRLNHKHLDNAREFIRNDRYQNATIVKHKEVNPELLSLPSCRLGVEIALEENADLHLWLEDDAIVFDKDCASWSPKIDIGLYRYTMHAEMVNCAFMLTSSDYDRKILPQLCSYEDDHKIYPNSSQIEHMFWQNVKTHVMLNPDNATRHHPYPPAVTKDNVRDWLRYKIPNIEQEDINMLDLDFDY